MTTTNYINSGYITKMGDASTNDGTAGRPVDSIDYPHSGLIKALNVMASTGHTVLNGSIGSGSKNFNMDMDDTTSSGYTTITVRAGTIVREGVLVSISQATLTEIASGSPSDVQFIEQGSSGENFYHVIVVNSSNVIKIRNPAAKDKVADLTNGDIPIAVLRAQNSETPTARHLQYLTTDVQSNSLSIAYDNSDVYTEMSKITAASGGTTIEVATAGGDFIIDNTDADKKIAMRLGSDTTATAFEIRNNSDAAKFSVDGAGTTDVKSLSLGTAGELTITESSDDITIKNTVSDKDIIFNVNDGGVNTEVMRIDGATSVVGIGTNAPDATLHIKATSGNNPVLKLENASTTANDEPALLFDRSAGSGSAGAIADGDNIGQIIFRSRNDAGTPESIDYASIIAEVSDVSDGTEDSKLIIYNYKGGTSCEYMRFGSSIIVNNGGANIDFVVEGDSETHLLFTDAGNDRVGIGNNTPMNILQINHTGADTDDGIMVVREDSSTADGDLLGGIGFDSTDGNVPSSITQASAFIASYATEDHATTDKGGNLKFGVSLIDDDDDIGSTVLANVGPPDTISGADSVHAGFNSRATTVKVGASTYAPTTGDSGLLILFNDPNSNLTLPSINHTNAEGVQFTVFNNTGSDIDGQIAVSNSATINGAAASASDDIETYKAATFIATGNNTWARIG